MISSADAEEFTSSLESIGDGWFRQLALGVRLGVPAALGLSRREWSDRIGVAMRSTVERREAVAELAAEGLSNRAIADILGVDKETVRNDIGENSPLQTHPPRGADDAGGEFSPRLIDDQSVEAMKDVIRQNNAKLAARPVDIPDDKFRTIVIDPGR
jgi:DNA-binding CsgD family transcriptional regulator